MGEGGNWLRKDPGDLSILPAGLQRALLSELGQHKAVPLSDLGDMHLVTLQSQKPDLKVGGTHAEAEPAPRAMCAVHTQCK